MRANSGAVLLIIGMMAGGTPVSAEPGLPCPGEVAQAKAMVAQADAVLHGGTIGNPLTPAAPPADVASATAGGRSLQGEVGSNAAGSQPASGALAGRTPLLGEGTGTARGLATSAASDISPWNPRPTDKTLEARTSKARTLTVQAETFCRAGQTNEAKAKALEAIGVLNSN